jgi:hypothetical protein
MEKRQVNVMVDRGGSYIMDGKKVSKKPIYKLGTFHEWEQYQDGDYSAKKAIVELEDGSVVRCDIDEVIFTKSTIQTEKEINKNQDEYLKM